MEIVYPVKRTLFVNHSVFGVFLQIIGQTIRMMKMIVAILITMTVQVYVMDFLKLTHIMKIVMVMVWVLELDKSSVVFMYPLAGF